MRAAEEVGGATLLWRPEHGWINRQPLDGIQQSSKEKSKLGGAMKLDVVLYSHIAIRWGGCNRLLMTDVLCC
jgi:hypothetical protein